jgi:hypothetical protein
MTRGPPRLSSICPNDDSDISFSGGWKDTVSKALKNSARNSSPNRSLSRFRPDEGHGHFRDHCSGGIGNPALKTGIGSGLSIRGRRRAKA